MPISRPIFVVTPSQSGFTLIELLLVVVIIAVAAGSVSFRIISRQVTDLEELRDDVTSFFSYARDQAIIKGKPMGVYLTDSELVLRSYSRQSAFSAADLSADKDSEPKSQLELMLQANSATENEEKILTYFSPDPLPAWQEVDYQGPSWDVEALTVNWLFETQIEQKMALIERKMDDLLNNETGEEFNQPPDFVFLPSGIVEPAGAIYAFSYENGESLSIRWQHTAELEVSLIEESQ